MLLGWSLAMLFMSIVLFSVFVLREFPQLKKKKVCTKEVEKNRIHVAFEQITKSPTDEDYGEAVISNINSTQRYTIYYENENGIVPQEGDKMYLDPVYNDDCTIEYYIPTQQLKTVRYVPAPLENQ